MENRETKLRRAFKNALGLDEQTDFETLEYAKSQGWDSIAHMQLVAAIEEEFDIMIATEDVLGMSSYMVTKDILKKYQLSFSQHG